MTTSTRYSVILAVVCGAVFFFNLGAARLFDEDEPKNAECGREMFERGDWLVPTYNYDLRTDKPIMLYWLMLGSFHLSGVSEFSARFPSAVMATLTIFCVFHIGRRLFDERVGFWSSLILASSLMYVTAARISTPDSTLIGFITLSLLIFVLAIPRSDKGWSLASVASKEDTSPPTSPYSLPAYWWQFAAMYGVMGLAVLTKGPVGFLLPCAVIGLFLLCQRNCPDWPASLSWRQPLRSAGLLLRFLAAFWAPKRFWLALWAMRPITLFFAVCLVALPWYVAVGLATDGAWLNGFLGNHNIGRFSSAMEGHHGPIFYYVITILMGFFPWSVFLPICLYLAFRQKEAHPADRRGLIFLYCWVGVYVVFFSLAQTKLPNYVLPCYPALALITGWTLVRFRENRVTLPNWAMNWGTISLMTVGVLLAIGFPIFSLVLLPGYASLGFIGILPLACGIWLHWQRREQQRQVVLPVMGVCSVLLVMASFSVVAPWVSRAQESSQLGLRVAEVSAAETPFATYRYYTTNLPFYAARPVLRYYKPEEIADYFSRHPEGVLCVQEHHLTELEQVLPERVKVINKTPRFLRPGEVLMLKHSVAQTAILEKLNTIR